MTPPPDVAAAGVRLGCGKVAEGLRKGCETSADDSQPFRNPSATFPQPKRTLAAATSGGGVYRDWTELQKHHAPQIGVQIFWYINRQLAN